MTSPSRLRVAAIVASAQLGGTERVLLDLARHADLCQLDLTVYSPSDGPLLARLAREGVSARVVAAPPRLLRASQQHGRMGTLPGAAAGLLRWAQSLSNQSGIRRADVVYTVGFKPHLALGLTHRRPLVWHVHEYPPATTGTLWRFLGRHLPNAVVANGVGVQRAWTNGSGASHFVVSNGVDLDVFKPQPSTRWIHRALGLPDDARLIGMVGVFAPWKGQLEVVNAFERVASRRPLFHLVLVGGAIYDTDGGGDFARSVEMARQRVPGRIHVLPFREDVERVYPEFDVTVHYSQRREPFGRVVLESMACGIPVLAAGEGGPLEILGAEPPDGAEFFETDSGWLVRPRDTPALSRTIDLVTQLGKDAFIARGAAARDRAEAHFNARDFARDLGSVLRQVARG
jgi:glycosyltransferase involved in cell wall biosynthesis